MRTDEEIDQNLANLRNLARFRLYRDRTLQANVHFQHFLLARSRIFHIINKRQEQKVEELLRRPCSHDTKRISKQYVTFILVRVYSLLRKMQNWWHIVTTHPRIIGGHITPDLKAEEVSDVEI